MNDMKFTTAGDYMEDVNTTPTGSETWQTKATAKGAVPKYYSPTELLSMKIDSMARLMNDYNERIKDLELAVANLNKRLSNITAEMLQPIDNDEIYERPKSK